MNIRTLLTPVALLAAPGVTLASEAVHHPMAETGDWRAILCVVIFVVAYIIVMTEEFHYLRKSKPMILAAGSIWLIIGAAARQYQVSEDILHEEVVYILHEFSSLFLFLLVSMTYINTLNERNFFGFIRSWLVRRGLSYRALFWVTGVLTFFFSSIADNLVSALLMGAVIMAVDKQNKRFVQVSCVNIVLAANCGGAFSPFGDITTLMVWQAGKVETMRFLEIFIPSLVSWLVPAIVMSLSLPKIKPEPLKEEVKLGQGWWVV
ncbi:MAG: sodium:proton antiporter NhaD, partial [Phycisphaerales bacterium]|nr:sodium:proton antiporter NhaD [Phycisphaerales bacterium]